MWTGIVSYLVSYNSAPSLIPPSHFLHSHFSSPFPSLVTYFFYRSGRNPRIMGECRNWISCYSSWQSKLTPFSHSRISYSLLPSLPSLPLITQGYEGKNELKKDRENVGEARYQVYFHSDLFSTSPPSFFWLIKLFRFQPEKIAALVLRLWIGKPIQWRENWW